MTMRIETPRLIIRSFEKSDYEGFCGYFRDESLDGLMAGHVYTDEASMRRLFDANCLNKYSYIIELKGEKIIAGEVHFADIISCYLAHIGFIIHRGYRQRGYGAEAVSAVIAHGFNELGFGRIRGICNLKNAASQKLMETCGFQQEALIYEGNFGGVVADMLYYSVTLADFLLNYDDPEEKVL